ncbi:MAG TPA: hypothetical protein VGP72_04455 [Planctomycetota bacterium]
MDAPTENPSPTLPPASEPAKEAKRLVLPAVKGAPHKHWTPAGPKISRRTAVLILVSATVAVIGLALVVARIAVPPVEAEAPRLGPEFNDPLINNFSIHPPLNWHLEDPHDDTNLFIKGPREPGFSPLIIVTLDVREGRLSSYLQLHKSRIEFEDKQKGGDGITWIGENQEESIDGCTRTARLEYECNLADEDGRKIKVRTLQYIMEDRPRFYRITCCATASVFDKYLARFEASARSFRRLPIGKEVPSYRTEPEKPLNVEKPAAEPKANVKSVPQP